MRTILVAQDVLASQHNRYAVTSTNDGNSGPATATLIVTGIMQQVPTLSEWALILLAGLLAIGGGGWAPARRRM
jgi:hypothetical protein